MDLSVHHSANWANGFVKGYDVQDVDEIEMANHKRDSRMQKSLSRKTGFLFWWVVSDSNARPTD